MRQLSQDAPEIQKALGETLSGPEADKAAEKAGERLGEQIGKGAAKAAKPGGKKAGDEYAGAFATAVKNGAKMAEKELGAIKVKVDDREANRRLADLQRRTKALQDAKIGIELDADAAVAEVGALRAELAALREGAEIDVDFNGAAAEAGLAAFEARLARLHPDVEVSVDTKQAEQQLGLFATRFERQMKSASNALGDGITGELANIRRQMLELGDKSVGVDLDAATARAKAKTLAAQLRALDGKDIRIDVHTNIDEAIRNLDAIGDRTKHAGIDANDSANSFRAFNAVILGATTLGPALIPILGAIAGGLTLIGPAALAAGGGLGVMLLGFSGVGDAVSAMGEAQQNAAKDTKAASDTMRVASQAVADAERNLARARADAAQASQDAARATSRVMADAAQANSDAARATADAIQAAAQARGDAARATADAEEDAARAIADAARTTSRARADAAQANRDAARATAEAVEAAAEAVKDAEQAVTDARRNAARVAIDQARAVTEARRSAAQADRQAAQDVAAAREQAADQIESAIERERDAQESLADAVESVQDAEENLREARKAAAEEQEDIADRIRQNALDERRAVIDLFNATVAYNATMNDPGATNLEREQADISLKQAQFDLEEIRETEKELAGQRRKGAKEGIDGNEGVRDAQEALLDAIKRQREAEEALGEASKAVTEARIEGAKAVNEALRAQNRITKEGQRNIAEALRKQAQAQRAATRAITEALEAERDARSDAAANVAEARREEARTAADGIRSISDARRNEARAAEDGAEAIADARRNEARVGRDGVESIAEARRNEARTARDGTQAINDARRNEARVAQDNARAIGDSRRNLNRAERSYRDQLRETAEVGSASQEALREAMGKLSPAGRRFARFLFSLRDEFGKLRAAAAAGMLPGVQNMLERLIDNYFPSFVRWVRRMSDVLGGLFEYAGRRMTKDGGGFVIFFEMMDELGPRFLRKFGKSMVNWLEAFLALMGHSGKDAMDFANALLRMSANARDWASSETGAGEWQTFLDYVTRVGPRVWDFFKALFRAIINVGEALSPFGEVILNLLTRVLKFVGRLDKNVLGPVLFGILALVAAFQLASLAIAAYAGFFAVLGGPIVAFGLTLGTVVAGLALFGAALFLLWTKSEKFRDIVRGAFKAVGKAISWTWDNFIKPVLKALGAAFDFVWDNFIKPVLDAVGELFGFLWKEVVKPILGFIMDRWDEVWKGVKRVWKDVLLPVIKAIAKIINWLWLNVFKPVLEHIGSRVKDVFEAIGWAWKNILSPVLELIIKGVMFLWRNGFKEAFGLIGKGWELLVKGMKWVWNNLLKPLFNLFMDVIGDDLVNAFKDGVERIANIWDRIKAIAAAPVKFVIETVLNNGLIAAFNWVAGKVGADKLGEIPLPNWISGGSKGDYSNAGSPAAHYKGGIAGVTGVMPGRSVNQDNMVIGVAGGEAVMRQEWTDVVGSGYVNEANRRARLYGRRGVEEMLGIVDGAFAGGGVVTPKKEVVWPTVGTTVHRTSYNLGHNGMDINQPPGPDSGAPIFAFRDGTISYVGWDRGYGRGVFQNTSVGEVVYGHTLAERTAPYQKAGKKVQAGDHIGYVGNTGNSSAPHLHFGFVNGGTFYNAEAALKGATKQVGSNYSSAAIGKGPSLPGWASDILSAPLDWMMDKMSSGLDAIGDKFGDNPFTDLVTAVPTYLAEQAKDWLTGEVRDYSHSFAPSSGPGSPAGSFGTGADAIWKSLMSTGAYSPKQAAGIMGNMYYESGFDHNIVQGGGYSRSPGGIGVGYGLVQWTPGTKLGAYIGQNTTTTVANSIDALTAQLKGRGPHAEAAAGAEFFRTNTVQGAAKSFELDYERHAGGAQPNRWAMAERILAKYAGGKSKGGIVGKGDAVEGVPTGLYDDGGLVPQGLSNVLNLTGGQEHMAVFTDDQWERIGNVGTSGHNIDIDLNGTDLKPKDVADELLFALRHADRGGRYGGDD